jgi:hypothetical protein
MARLLQVVSEDRRDSASRSGYGVALSSTPAARGQSLLVQLVGALEIAEVSRGL